MSWQESCGVAVAQAPPREKTVMRQLFYSGAVGSAGSLGLLMLRLVMGAAFLFHGWPKIQNPFGWMGPEAAMPGVLQSLAALSELGAAWP